MSGILILSYWLKGGCAHFTFNWLTLTSEMHFVKFHPEVASCLLSRGKRKYAPLGMRLLWKYMRNYFLVYHLTPHFLLYLQNYNVQRIWSWNFRFANRKIWTFIWYQKNVGPTSSGWALGDETVIGIRAFKEVANSLYLFLNFIDLFISLQSNVKIKMNIANMWLIPVGRFTYVTA